MIISEEIKAGIITPEIAKEPPSHTAFQREKGGAVAANNGNATKGKNARIQHFLSKMYSNRDTGVSSASAVYSFFDYIYDVELRVVERKCENGEIIKKKILPTPAIIAEYEKLAERYLTEQRDYMDDLLGFIISLAEKPPGSRRMTVSRIRTFLAYYKIVFPDDEEKIIKSKLGKGIKPSSKRGRITKDIIRKVLVHMDLRDRAVTLLLASSGMRIGEAVQIELDDITFGNPTKIEIIGKYTKTETRRTTFISSEATKCLKEWLKQRDSYLAQSVKIANHLYEARKMNNTKDINDNRIFPFSDTNFRVAWDNAFKKADLYEIDKSTGRTVYRVHGLRAFFRTALGNTMKDSAEAIMGHEGYLTNAYRDYSEEELAKSYLENEHLITIAGGGNMQELNDKLEDTKEELEDTRTVVGGYKYRIKELEDRLKQVESEKERRIEPLLNELNDFPELRQMFNSFLTSFEARIKQIKGEEPELEMTLEEAESVTGDTWVKVKGGKKRSA